MSKKEFQQSSPRCWNPILMSHVLMAKIVLFSDYPNKNAKNKVLLEQLCYLTLQLIRIVRTVYDTAVTVYQKRSRNLLNII